MKYDSSIQAALYELFEGINKSQGFIEMQKTIHYND
jgi:hypothetical protein